MILKIHTEDQGWVFYDEIAKLRVFSGEWKEQLRAEGEPIWYKLYALVEPSGVIEPDWVWINYKSTAYKEEGGMLTHGFCSIASCLLKNGDYRMIAFTTAFLLNNEGKTIEKL